MYGERSEHCQDSPSIVRHGTRGTRARGALLVTAALLLPTLSVAAAPSPGDIVRLPESPTLAASSAEPVFIGGTGNHECDDFQGSAVWRTLKIDPPQSGTFSDGVLTVTVAFTSPKGFDWSSNIGVDAVFVKAGREGSHLYVYDPEVRSDTGLTSPGSGTGNEVSHVSFCYDTGDVGARISLSPLSSTVPAGSTVTLVALVQRVDDGVPSPVAGALVSGTIAAGPGAFVGGATTCTTDAAGTCGLPLSSTVSGTTLVSAASNVTIGGATFRAATDGTAGSSGPASIVWEQIASTTVGSPSVPSITVGQSLLDGASVSGPLGTPTGALTFFLCAPSEVAAGGGCPAGGSLVGTAPLANGSAASTAVSPGSPGVWCFRAAYSGDRTYLPSADGGPGQCFEVLSPPLSFSAQTVGASAVLEPGTTVTDTAFLSGPSGAPAPAGTVTFFLCSPAEVTASGCASGGAIVGTPVAIGTDGKATSAPAPAGLAPGTYCWRAEYSGDGVYAPATFTDPALQCFRVGAPSLLPAFEVRNVDAAGTFAGSADASPGDVVEYRATVTNAGDATASAARLTTTVPPRATLTSCSVCSFAATGPGSLLEWSLGALAPGATSVQSFTVRLDGVFPRGSTTLSTTATATTPETGAATSAPATITVTASPVLNVLLEARDVDAAGPFATSIAGVPGALIEYRATITNTGDADATGLRLEDVLPPGTALDSCTPACSFTGTGPGSLVSWDLGSLAAGATTAVTLRLRLDPVFPDGQSVVSNAARGILGGATTDSNPAIVLVTAAPGLASLFEVRNVDTLTAFAPSTSARPGHVLEYRVTVVNDGNADATGVRIDTSVPARSGLVACSDACFLSGTAAGSSIAWSLAGFPAGATRQVTFRVVLDSGFPAGVTDVVATGRAGLPGRTPVALPPATASVSADPILSLGLGLRNVNTDPQDPATPCCSYALTGSARPGHVIEYRVSFVNAGDGHATGAVVTLARPPRSSFVACDPACTLTGTPPGAGAEWAVGTLAAGTVWVATLQVRLDAEFPAGTTVLRSVAAGTTNEAPSLSSDPVDLSVVAEPAFAVLFEVRNVDDAGAFAASASATPGALVEYRVTVRNAGDATASQTSITTSVPQRATLTSCSLCSSTGTGPGSLLSWNLGTLAPGETSTRSVSVRLDPVFPAGETTLLNTATAATPEIPSETSGPATVLVTAHPVLTVLVEARNVDEAGAFAESVAARPGDLVEYRVTITNRGNAGASGLLVEATVPDRSVLAACPAPCSFSGTGPGSPLAWDLATLGAGEYVFVLFRVTLVSVFPAGETVVPARATATSPDAATPAAGSADVIVTAAPRLLVTFAARNLATGSGYAVRLPARPSHGIEYRVSVANAGDADAGDVRVATPVPARSTLETCPGPCAPGGTAPESGLAWTLGTLPAGASAAVGFTARLDPVFPAGETPIPTTATAVTPETPPVASQPVELVVAAAPRLAAVLEARNVDAAGPFAPSVPARPGNLIEYRLTLLNHGDADATGTLASTTGPARSTILSCPGPCHTAGAAPGSSVSWTVGSLPAGGSTTLLMGTRLDAVFPAGETPVATAASTEADIVPPFSSEAVTVVVSAAPALGLSKTASAPVVAPGGTVRFDLAYFNTGDADVLSAAVVDLLPPGTAFVSCVPACSVQGTTVSFAAGAIPAGTSAAAPAGALALTARIVQVVACSVCNSATIVSTDPAGLAPVASNVACVEVSLSVGPPLATGFAWGLFVRAPGLIDDVEVSQVSTYQQDPGSDVHERRFTEFREPPAAGGIVQARARVFPAFTKSTVTASPSLAAAETSIEVADLELLNGFIRADLVRSVATASAGPGGARSASTEGTAILGLVIGGTPVDVKGGGTQIGLPPGLFGEGSYVRLLREPTWFAERGPCGVTYSAHATTVTLDVHVTDRLATVPGNQPLEIRVGYANSNAEHP